MNLLERIQNCETQELVLSYTEASVYFPAANPVAITFETGVDSIALRHWCDKNKIKFEIIEKDQHLPSYKITI